MTNAIQKPRFEEVVEVTTINLPDFSLKFNAQRVGPTNFNGLRTANYGPYFRMPTMPELVPLVYASLENQDKETAKNVIKTLKSNWLTGNTAIHYFPGGMFVEDNPEMKNKRIVTPTQKALEERLDSHEEMGVVFSRDKSIRFVPYVFKTKLQTALELARNPGIIALTGSEENAEMLAKAFLELYNKSKTWFSALSEVDWPQTRVASLGLDDIDWLLVGAVDTEGALGGSFGVFDVSAEGTR